VRARRRAAALWVGVAAAVALAVVWRARSARDEVGARLGEALAITTRALLVRVTDWAQARSAHAETVAALLGGTAAGEPAAAQAALERAMEALARRQAFVAGRVLDAAGRVVAAVPAAPERPPHAAPDAVSHDEPAGARAVIVPCGRGAGAYCVEFHAPVRRGDRRVGTLVLVAAVDDSTFRPLNAFTPDVRTSRTSVLAPLGPAGPAGPGAGAPADTLAVVASLGAPDSPEPPPRLAAAALPAHVRRAFAAPAGRVTVDTARGLRGTTTHYAVVRVPELGWVVLRDLERAELLAGVRRALLVEEPILVTLFVSVVALTRQGVRARRARRDRELARLRADFVASTSHELRTPLAQIRMFAELLQKPGALRGPGESARALRIIEKEASRLTILVDNLLNYGRLRRRADDAAAAAAAEPAHVADEVAHVIEAFAPLAAERGARVVSTVPAGLHVRVDELALRQVLTNYLENAVKYGPPGQTVTVGADADAACVRIRVDDQGRGVPPDERELVWDAFRRGRGAEASAHGGSGIGLAVVRELALQYGGGVRVEDAPAGGARFVAEFPRAPGAARGAAGRE
jgi:signal transduction histidine kinase